MKTLHHVKERTTGGSRDEKTAQGGKNTENRKSCHAGREGLRSRLKIGRELTSKERVENLVYLKDGEDKASPL